MRRPVLSVPALTVVLAGVLALGACSGSSGSGGSDASSTPSAAATAAPAPEALSGFSCVAGADGLWTATGTISNDTDAPASYTVDVYVGPADGQERPANRAAVENVQAGESTPVQIAGVTAQGDPNECHVRVLRALP
ncbi:hypothetical protein [Aeromicrobium sp. Leaf350]|uniref:hypothetical protein n=1 Tax=Aeromicrobium sp. Leaf350 TaxID=2876565 RepID=UPI001E2C46EE|nr:hypothetical protein [Aeromicrobium sp. Leaf350]